MRFPRQAGDVPSLAEPVSGGFPRSNFRMFHVKHHIKIKQSWLQTTSRRQLKSFSVQQFFKNAAEVWASSPHLRSKSKLHYEIKQTSKKQSEESQLLLKSKGCNEIQGFRGNCDSQGKLGMCPSLAEPDLSGVPRTNRRQPKVFCSSNFSKMLARFRASSPDRCPQAAKFPCHAFGTRRGW